MIEIPDQRYNSRPSHSSGFLELPLCRLHVARAGSGPPLVMLPATVSLLENWYELIDFAAQWFEVIFFELPGHGQSACFQQPFSTALMGPLVEQIADHLGWQRFSLMGFSFGGVLTMEALMYLQSRVEQVMLLAPCLTGRAIQLSVARRAAVLRLAGVFQRPGARAVLYRLLHDLPYRPYSAALLRSIGSVEDTIPMEQVLEKILPATLEILSVQITAALQYECQPEAPFEIPCYFAMSVIDPLIDYATTRATLARFFAQPAITELHYPFHQPPRPFTFDEMNAGYRQSVEEFLQHHFPRSMAPLPDSP